MGIAALIDRAAAECPDSIAVECGNQRLTYGELVLRANQLAYLLIEHGVGPNALVAVHCGRSVELVVSELAVLKAGGAFVPLDPNDPSQRNRLILAETRPAVILTAGEIRSVPAEASIIDVTRIDGQAPLPVAIDRREARPEDLAYVLFTSGSTGRPKGVEIPRRAMLNHCLAITRAYELAATDRVLQCIAPTFDISLEEIFPTWIAGATLVIRRDGPSGTASEFLDEVQQRELTVLNLPTALWTELVNAAGRDPGLAWSESLRLIVVGGEKVSSEVHANWRGQDTSHIRWLNGYGPTEATVTATLYDDVGHIQTGQGTMPIGRPIENVSAYVLDEQQNVVPVGEPGELHLGGRGLARGYFNDEILTRERFGPNPFIDGELLFSTGDIVSRQADGNLIFLRRTDGQIKLRGFRIELGEIECVLEQFGGVGSAVVLPEEVNGLAVHLHAFVIPSEGVTTDTPQLLGWLRERLPSHMVPTTVQDIGRFPLTPAGKIDRAALLAQADAVHQHAVASTESENALERELVELWCEVLQTDRVGTQEHFFDLGGHSLLAMHMLAEVESRLGLTCGLKEFFQGPTIEELAEVLRPSDAATGPGIPEIAHAVLTPEVMALNAGTSSVPLFCIGAIARYDHLVRELRPEQNVYAVFCESEADLWETVPSVPEMARAYIRAIAEHDPHGPYCLLGDCYYGLVAYEMAQQLRSQGKEVALLGIIDPQMPIGERAWPIRWAMHRQRRSFAARAFLRACDFLDRMKPVARVRKMMPVRLWAGLRAAYIWVLSGKGPKGRVREGANSLEQARDHGQHVSSERYQTAIRPYQEPVVIFRSLLPYRHDMKYAIGLRHMLARLTKLWWQEPLGGLAPMLGGDVTVVEVLSDGHHMMRSSHVGRVAKELAHRIDRAEASARGSIEAEVEVAHSA